MPKITPIIARNDAELAVALDLSPADAANIQIRRQLADKIIEVVKKSGLTHAGAAKTAKTSRTRLTAIMNRNTHRVSTDLMLRILLALGYRAKITFTRSQRAA